MGGPANAPAPSPRAVQPQPAPTEAAGGGYLATAAAFPAGARASSRNSLAPFELSLSLAQCPRTTSMTRMQQQQQQQQPGEVLHAKRIKLSQTLLQQAACGRGERPGGALIVPDCTAHIQDATRPVRDVALLLQDSLPLRSLAVVSVCLGSSSRRQSPSTAAGGLGCAASGGVLVLYMCFGCSVPDALLGAICDMCQSQLQGVSAGQGRGQRPAVLRPRSRGMACRIHPWHITYDICDLPQAHMQGPAQARDSAGGVSIETGMHRSVCLHSAVPACPAGRCLCRQVVQASLQSKVQRELMAEIQILGKGISGDYVVTKAQPRVGRASPSDNAGGGGSLQSTRETGRRSRWRV